MDPSAWPFFRLHFLNAHFSDVNALKSPRKGDGSAISKFNVVCSSLIVKGLQRSYASINFKSMDSNPAGIRRCSKR